MKNFVRGIAIAAALGASVSAASAANLIKNGNFDAGGSPSLDDWGHSGAVAASNSTAYKASNVGGTGTGSSIFAAFGGGQLGDGALTQSFTTVKDAFYTLTFDYGAFAASGGSAQSLLLTVGDKNKIVTDSSLKSSFNEVFDGSFSITFKALADLTTLSFYDISEFSTNADMLIKNVQVNAVAAVPGPEAGAGLGAVALGGMAFWMARRRKSSSAAA